MRVLTAVLSLPLIAVASCGSAQSGDSAASAAAGAPAPTETKGPFAVAVLGTFKEPWALAVEPGTNRIFVTEKAGTVKVVDPATGQSAAVSGVPEVSYGGQGGLHDIAFAPDYASSGTIYLSWVSQDAEGNRYGTVGRGKLACAQLGSCAIQGLSEIWRQNQALRSFGHYSIRLAFAPDGQHLFVSSGEQTKGDPAQDMSVNLGKVVRLNLDGTPAAGNPFAGQANVSPDIWSYGHRNLLGLAFDADGQLWDIEHGPAGGDEINLIVPGDNYGWPVVSNGDNYNGTPIPRHSTRPEFHAPAISWNPVIAPGGMIFYSGKLWPAWKGNAIVTGLKTEALVRVGLSGEKGTEEARYEMGKRLRGIAEAPDGAIYVAEDGEDGRLLRLTPAG